MKTWHLILLLIVLLGMIQLYDYIVFGIIACVGVLIYRATKALEKLTSK